MLLKLRNSAHYQLGRIVTMIRRIIMSNFILFFAATGAIAGNSQEREGRWDEVKSIDGLPFCALILSNVYDKAERERRLDILMEPGLVTESNLYLLFRILPKKFQDDARLVIWVNTNVKQLAMLATGMGGSGPSKRGRTLQLAYYRRTQTVELFSYNPNYPKPGEKTVIISGKED